MSATEKELLEKLKKMAQNNPDEFRKLFENEPALKTIFEEKEELPITYFEDEYNQIDNAANDIGGQRKNLAIPGRANMYDNNEKGFSNYFLLAVFAFVIQFFITLVCIFFYK